MTDTSPVANNAGIDRLFEINDQIPPPLLSTHSESVTYHESVEAIYNALYAPALNKFIETRWYTISGLQVLRRNSRILAEFTAYVKAATAQPNEPSPPNLLAHETRLIWYLLNLCCLKDTTFQSLSTSVEDSDGLMNIKSAPPIHMEGPLDNDTLDSTIATEGSNMIIDPQGSSYTQEEQTTALIEAAILANGTAVVNSSTLEDSTDLVPSWRLEVLVSLLTNSSPGPTHPSNQPLILASTAHEPHSSKSVTTLARQLKAREDEFWSCIGQYVSASFPASQEKQPQEQRLENNANQKKQALYRARTLLDGRENRDVIYTIMKMRYLQSLCNASAEGDKQAPDIERQWRFGMKVLRNEAGLADGGDGVTSGIGTNVVAMRVAAMAVRAFE